MTGALLGIIILFSAQFIYLDLSIHLSMRWQISVVTPHCLMWLVTYWLAL